MSHASESHADQTISRGEPTGAPLASPGSTPSSPELGFPDRRNPTSPDGPPGVERRQFANSYEELSPEAQKLAQAVDQYKIQHRRRFITYEELLAVIKELGYQLSTAS